MTLFTRNFVGVFSRLVTNDQLILSQPSLMAESNNVMDAEALVSRDRYRHRDKRCVMLIAEDSPSSYIVGASFELWKH